MEKETKFINNIHKKDIILCLDILLYNYEEILSIDYEYINKHIYKKIIFIYNIINKLLNKLYHSYGSKSILILDKWYKGKKELNIDILDESIDNFMINYKE